MCQSCGTVHSKWAGKCDGCAEWDTLVEERVEQAPKAMDARKKGKGIEFTA